MPHQPVGMTVYPARRFRGAKLIQFERNRNFDASKVDLFQG